MGYEGKAGISKELIKGSQGNRRKYGKAIQYGRDWKLSGALGAGPLSINAEKSLVSENAAIGGNIFLYDMKAGLNATTERINILDLNFYFGLGGSLKIFINIDSPSGYFPIAPDTYEMRVDNTYVWPYNKY
ncbi:hypothetical protein SAMN06265379_103409 [Saccharicrinis carchari]|uniref:Uncharacterized protein n=1 Tax=Saccharicrinis carchari TaxID=1168039 RepID=A0A521CRR9_SACCC|nr:hypothetical protein [Saccharicrinis carchari]SMO62179.1 hypothetical protein SAMN06265379_103409 [Saccharicrinis carchari]